MDDKTKGSHNEHSLLKEAVKDEEGMVKYAVDLPEEGYEKLGIEEKKNEQIHKS